MAMPQLEDHLMAHDAVSFAFMAEVAVELARQKPDPEEWVRTFISRLHARLDANEAFMGERASLFPVHEVARKQIDALATVLQTELLDPRR